MKESGKNANFPTGKVNNSRILEKSEFYKKNCEAKLRLYKKTQEEAKKLIKNLIAHKKIYKSIEDRDNYMYLASIFDMMEAINARIERNIADEKDWGI